MWRQLLNRTFIPSNAKQTCRHAVLHSLCRWFQIDKKFSPVSKAVILFSYRNLNNVSCRICQSEAKFIGRPPKMPSKDCERMPPTTSKNEPSATSLKIRSNQQSVCSWTTESVLMSTCTVNKDIDLIQFFWKSKLLFEKLKWKMQAKQKSAVGNECFRNRMYAELNTTQWLKRRNENRLTKMYQNI